MPELEYSDWQLAPFEAPAAKRMDWVEQAVSEGDNWWKSMPSAATADKNLALLGADNVSQKLKSNFLKSDIRKFVETISDVREIATFGSGAEQFKSFVELFNKTVKFIYHKSHFPRQSRKALQYAVGLGRGYIWPRYIRKGFGWDEGCVEFKDLGPREVLPTQLPSDNDIQGSYAVTIFDCLGIAEAHARFPRFQEALQPISKGKITSNGQVRRYEFWDRWKYGQTNRNWDEKYCEIRWTFVRDLRINKTGETLKMGDPGTSWYYEVPSMKSQIVTIKPENKLPQSRTATEEDCRVYPQLRLLLTNPGMSHPLYDGPAFDWDGMMPAIPYDVDDWPWLAVGYSLLQDVAGIERAQRGFMDLMYRVLRAKMKPAMGYDLNAGIPREDIKRFDVLEESELGTTLGVDGDPTKALRSVVPDSVAVNGEDFKFLEVLDKSRQKGLGLPDLGSLAQLKFNLSSETADKLLETIGPIAKGIAGNMEASHAKIAYKLKYMIPQYFSTSKLISIVGPEAVSSQVFDHEPDSLVPSHMPEESLLKANGAKSNYPAIERAKRFARELEVISVPSFLLNITQMQEQLKWLNLFQQKAPVSFHTVAKKLGIENYGEAQGATEWDKWKWEQREIAIAKVETMKTVQADIPEGGSEGGKGQGKGGGRTPTAQKAPHLEQRGQKSGKPRTVISQSK